MDGYFPSELKQYYPDGLIFRVTDKSGEKCRSNLTDEHNDSNSVYPSSNLSADDLLKKLPQHVVRSGQVIDIRSSISQVLQLNSERNTREVIMVDSDALHLLQNKLLNGNQVTTLKITMQDIGIFMIKLQRIDTVGILRKLIINQTASDVPCQQIELRTVFPLRIYTDDAATLESVGLFPNANILARIIE